MSTFPKFRTLPITCLVLALLALYALVSCVSNRLNEDVSDALDDLSAKVDAGTGIESETESGRKVDIEALTGELETIFDRAYVDYKRRVEAALTGYEQAQAAAVDLYARNSREAFERAVNQKISHFNIMKLIGLMARDMVKDEDGGQAGEWILLHLVLPIRPHLLSYREATDLNISRLGRDHAEALGAMEQNLLFHIEASVTDKPQNPDAATPLARAFGSNMSTLNLALAVGIPAAIAPLDAYSLLPEQRKQMTEAISKAVGSAYRKFAEKRLSKQAKPVAAGIGAALVDGPFPIGDIVTVILTGWTAWEIFFMAEDMREKLMHGYDQGLSRLKKDVSRELLPSVKKSHHENVKKVCESRGLFIESILSEI